MTVRHDSDTDRIRRELPHSHRWVKCVCPRCESVEMVAVSNALPVDRVVVYCSHGDCRSTPMTASEAR